MARLASIATGNFTNAATWGVIDGTLFFQSETSTLVCPTSYSNVARSATATPGAIIVSHIGIRLAVRTGTTGTITVNIADSSFVEISGTAVTINTADLPVAATADLNGGWIFFKLGTAVTLSASTIYVVQARTSSSTQVSVFGSAATNGMSCLLITTTTGAPAAGDDMIVAGEKTGAGTSNAFVVTMDNQNTTDFGAGSTSLVTPALAICHQGNLLWGALASTAYQLKISGNSIVYSGGALNEGTVAIPIPRGSSTLMTYDCVANVDFGLTVRNLGIYVDQGQSRTAAKLIYFCKLNTDEAAAQTVLGVDTDTGWLAGDEIVIVSTSRTGSQTEIRTLSVDATATELTITVGLTNAHSGTSPTQAEVGLLTRNNRVQGTSATVQSYIDIRPTAQVDVDWAEFRFMGSATTQKRGIDVATTTGSTAFTYCSFRDFAVASSAVIITGAATNNYTFQYIVSYNMSLSFSNAVTTGSAWTVDNWIATGQIAAATITFSFLDVGGTITNITAAGNASTGGQIQINQFANMGTIGNLVAHSNGGVGIYLLSFMNGTVTGTTTSWRNNTIGFQTARLGNITFAGGNIFGNVTTNINFITSIENTYFNSFVVSADTTFAVTNGITYSQNAGGTAYFNDSTFGVVSGIKAAHTNDILAVAGEFLNLKFNNCLLASTTELSTQTSMPPGISYGSSKHDQTAGNHRTFKREGTITIDTTIFDTTPSVRMTPNSSIEKLSSGSKKVAVEDTNTVTVSVKVRESVAGDGTDYNGARIRLIVKKNAAAGIASDTVLATATVSSEGAFETISGTTGAVTDNAVLEFFIDADGTTGWINIDTWTTS